MNTHEGYQKISTGYTPRRLQKKIHRELKRFNVLVCHRRFGKTVLCINELVDQCIRNEKKEPRYAYFAPFYAQAKKIAWDYLKEYTRNIPGAKFNEQELRADLPGGRRIYIAGADNPDSHRGVYFDGVVLDEFAQMNPYIWSEVVRPALTDREGFAIFIGTPKGRNAFYDIYEMAKSNPEWYTAIFKASETGVIQRHELDQLKAEMGEDAFNQEFECSFDSAVKGAYYSHIIQELEKKGQIRNVPYDRNLGVITAWDLGMSDSTAIWFVQRLFQEVRVIDYMEVSGLGMPEIARELHKKPYTYTTHLLPHDAAVRELGTGKARTETLHNNGIKNPDVMPRLSLHAGIDLVRNLLPMCYFDREKAHLGLEALREYRREWDEKKQTFNEKPLHNKYSHGADAFRTLAVGIDRERPLDEPKRAITAITDYDELGGGTPYGW